MKQDFNINFEVDNEEYLCVGNIIYDIDKNYDGFAGNQMVFVDCVKFDYILDTVGNDVLMDIDTRLRDYLEKEVIEHTDI